MPTNKLETNTLYTGDCLGVMRTMREKQVDLIYLDPPFNSKADYNITFGTHTNGKASQLLAFTDTWEWGESAIKRVESIEDDVSNPARDAIIGLKIFLGESGMLSYLSYMAERLIECKRLLKDTGSVYLHCDPTASHYLKLVMDAVFKHKNFRNEIVWYYRRWSGASKQFQKMHDIIFWYSNGGKHLFTKPLQPYSRPEDIETTVRGIVDGKLVRLRDEEGNYIQREQENKGVLMHDTWTDINFIPPTSKERTGYPTQKPLDLLKRIIEASSNKDDFILDPFCGCGTTVVAANELNRQWAGIDISSYAVNTVMRERLINVGVECVIKDSPTDLKSAKRLSQRDSFLFEKWAVTQINGAVPNEKQRFDKGIDGKAILHEKKIEGFNSREILFQVKGGKSISINDVRAFKAVVDRERAVAGVFIVLENKVVSAGMKQEFLGAGNYHIGATPYQRMSFWSIEDYFKKIIPKISPLAIPTNPNIKIKSSLWS